MAAPSAAWSACTLVWVCVVASSVYLLPVRYEIKVEVLVVVGLCLRFLQAILGPMRRISGEKNVQYAAMAAYYLPSFLAYSAAGSLSSSSDSILYYIMWCLLLLMISAFGRTEMRVYTLTAGDNQRWVLLKWMFYLACVQVGLIWTDHQKLTLSRFFCFLLNFVWFLGILSVKPQVSTLDTNIKPIAEYMEQEYEDIVTINKQADDTIWMSAIKFPLVPGSDGQMVTIDNIPPRSTRVTTDDEDLMLAYSYSNLLARRYFGFHCPEENCPHVRAYALAQLQQHMRAFKIIEVQLAFLHDYFFATYGHIVWRSCTCYLCDGEETMIKITEITSSLKVMLTATAVTVWAYLLFIVGGTFGGHKAAFHVVASLLLVLNAWFYAKPVVPFYWDSIRTAFWTDCVSAAHKFVRWCHSPHYSSSRAHPQQPYYWQEKIGQYSLMEDYDRISWKNTIAALFKEHVLGQVVSHNFTEHYPAEEDPVGLKPSVKQSVAGCLSVIRGPPTNGKTFLARNGVLDDFGSTLKEEAHHTHTILIWHIATWYCSKFLPMQLGDYSHAEVAEALSKYCAYLVAFLPELLPDHSLDAKKALQEVIEMAKDTLGTERMTMEQKHEQIRGLLLQGLQQSPPEDEMSSLNTFDDGINLGLQLVLRDSDIKEENHVSSWKVMADFWTETILYIAPSENAAAHIEQLAKGGEFVTHLWALLSNAGIYERAS